MAAQHDEDDAARVMPDPVSIGGLIEITSVANDGLINGREVSIFRVNGIGFDGSPITVTISQDGVDFQSTVNASGGIDTWSASGFDLSGFNDGPLTITASVDGDDVTASATLDRIAPDPPSIGAVADDDVIEAGEVGAVTFSGVGVPGSEIRLDVTAGVFTLIALTDADAVTGAYDFSVDVGTLPNASLTFSVRAIDEAGNRSDATTRTVQKTDALPGAPTIDGSIMGDDIVNAAEDEAVKVNGTADAGADVSVAFSDGDNAFTLTATADGDGDWSISGVDFTLFNEGPITLTATQTVGALQSAATEATVGYDRTPPGALTGVVVGTDGVIGPDVAGALTVMGTGAEVGAAVTIDFEGPPNTGFLTATVTADGGGAFAFAGGDALDLSGLPNGDITVTVRQIDEAGNVSNGSQQTVLLQKFIPEAPTVDGPIAADGWVNAAEIGGVTFTGTGLATATLNYAIEDENGALRTGAVTVGGDGRWTTGALDLSPFEDAAHTILVTQTFDNVESAERSASFLVDANAPDRPVVDPIAGDDAINANDMASFSISCTGEAFIETAADNDDVTVTVVIDDGQDSITRTVTAEAKGAFQFDNLDVTSLRDGNLTFTVTQTDAAGNTSAAEERLVSFTSARPNAPTITTPVAGDNFVNADEAASGVVVTGTGTAGASLRVTFGFDSQTLTVDGNGEWESDPFNLGPFNPGPLSLSARQTIDSVESDSVSTSIVYDPFVPADPVITTPIAGDNLVDTAERVALVIEGTGDAGTVELTISDGVKTITRTVDVDGNGDWSMASAPADLSDLRTGEIGVTAQSVDEAGNRSGIIPASFELLGTGFGTTDDSVAGGATNDVLWGLDGRDTMTGGGGNDTMRSGADGDMVDGGTGDDRLNGQGGDDDVRGGAGQDTVLGGEGEDTLSGGGGNDRMNGEEGADSMKGGDGADSMKGGGGGDQIYGGAGGDVISGEDGDDTLFGGRGDDTLFGQDGADALKGGIGNDCLSGGEGVDTLHGNDGDDALFGRNGDDALNGGDGADALSGGNGNDRMIGGVGADHLRGGVGEDLLFGGDDNDTLYGGGGRDTLVGGAGADTFVVDSLESDDVIRDFEEGVDQVVLFADLLF